MVSSYVIIFWLYVNLLAFIFHGQYIQYVVIVVCAYFSLVDISWSPVMAPENLLLLLGVFGYALGASHAMHAVLSVHFVKFTESLLMLLCQMRKYYS